MYRVIKYFTDLHDNNYPYDVGDIYPRQGLEVSEARLLELASFSNRRGEPMIQKVEVKKPVEVEKPATPKKRTTTKKKKVASE